MNHLDSVKLSADGSAVDIIDQTLLPQQFHRIELRTREEIFEAIHELRVRGAPAIGICAGYGLYVLAAASEKPDFSSFLAELAENAAYLNSARPTAVNLGWALRRMERTARAEGSVFDAKAVLRRECQKIHEEDIAMCRQISENGLTLLRDGCGILTHCNAGPLATSRYGTALGPILLGRERGMSFRVFADETRPLLQGARLTSYELDAAGVDVTLICDSMAASVMQQRRVDAVLVGCDRVAANGDTANKIGTCGLAIIAKHYGVPFYVLGPTSTIDLGCRTGGDIEIELREPEEIKEKFFAEPVAPKSVRCYNPAFDVTPSELISGIVTERGICRAPYNESIKKLFLEDKS